jgi:hypothetical protein
MAHSPDLPLATNARRARRVSPCCISSTRPERISQGLDWSPWVTRGCVVKASRSMTSTRVPLTVSTPSCQPFASKGDIVRPLAILAHGFGQIAIRRSIHSCPVVDHTHSVVRRIEYDDMHSGFTGARESPVLNGRLSLRNGAPSHLREGAKTGAGCRENDCEGEPQCAIDRGHGKT